MIQAESESTGKSKNGRFSSPAVCSRFLFHVHFYLDFIVTLLRATHPQTQIVNIEFELIHVDFSQRYSEAIRRFEKDAKGPVAYKV